MFTLDSFDAMPVDTIIAQGTATNGPGETDKPIPVLAGVPPRSPFTWVAKRVQNGWNITVNGNLMPIQNRAMIQRLVPCTDDVLTFYYYGGGI